MFSWLKIKRKRGIYQTWLFNYRAQWPPSLLNIYFTVTITIIDIFFEKNINLSCHQLSHRMKHPKVTVNCAALPENLVEGAIIITTGNTLQIELPSDQYTCRGQARTLEDIQKEYILDILETTKWCIRGKNGAAEISGLKPTTLESRMAKLGIRRPSKKKHQHHFFKL